jgi:hypothetical protein
MVKSLFIGAGVAMALAAADGALRELPAQCRDCFAVLDQNGNEIGMGCAQMEAGYLGCSVNCPPNEPCTCDTWGDACPDGFAVLEVGVGGELEWVVANRSRRADVALASVRIECGASSDQQGGRAVGPLRVTVDGTQLART